VPTRLVAFSDDMDGLRKVPDNVPNKEMLAEHLGKPLTRARSRSAPTRASAITTTRACAASSTFGFEYEFQSATDCYRSGRFDAALLQGAGATTRSEERHAADPGPERRATYSPFLPICPKTGRVLQVPILERDGRGGHHRLPGSRGRPLKVEVPVTGGQCKLQWKADWAMRWAALGVDYEMSGKDLIDSVKLVEDLPHPRRPPARRLQLRALPRREGREDLQVQGQRPAVEEWLTYAPAESLALFMFQKPRAAKRLYFDVIPRAVDDYLSHLAVYNGQDEKRLENPVWHIHNGQPPVRAPSSATACC
jgi:lysyl-tRNA synthetase, class I